jgi:PTS hybrid protein
LVGIVVVSHSEDLARGLVDLAGQVAGPDVRILPAGGGPGGSLGTDDDRVREAIKRADQGSGVVILCDLGSAPGRRTARGGRGRRRGPRVDGLLAR